MRTIRNRFLEARTARDIDAQVTKILRGLGNPTGPIELADVRALLQLDRQYYSSTNDGLLRELIGKAKVASPLILCGERGRTRTYNQVIKSHLLYQLSYAPLLRKNLAGSAH